MNITKIQISLRTKDIFTQALYRGACKMHNLNRAIFIT